MGYGNDNVSITGTEMKFALSLELPGGSRPCSTSIPTGR